VQCHDMRYVMTVSVYKVESGILTNDSNFIIGV
jgi:hypothetical protein